MAMKRSLHLWLARLLLPEGWGKINGRIVELEPWDALNAQEA